MPTLEERQAEMLQKNLAERKRQKQEILLANSPKKEEQPEERVNCIRCKHRVAREGSVFCSRCTGKALEQDLRSELPPSMLPVPKVQSINQENFSTGEQDEIYDVPVSSKSSDNGSDSNFTLNQNTKTYTRSQVSKILGVSNTTLCRWERKGKIPQPKRLTHTNQCLYTDELIEAAREYMSQEYVPQTMGIPKTAGGRLLMAAKKTVKINKRAESAVASRLGTLGRRVL